MKTFDEATKEFDLTGKVGTKDPDEVVKQLMVKYGDMIREIRTHSFTGELVQDQELLYMVHAAEHNGGISAVCHSMFANCIMTAFVTGILIGMDMERGEFPDAT